MYCIFDSIEIHLGCHMICPTLYSRFSGTLNTPIMSFRIWELANHREDMSSPPKLQNAEKYNWDKKWIGILILYSQIKAPILIHLCINRSNRSITWYMATAATYILVEYWCSKKGAPNNKLRFERHKNSVCWPKLTYVDRDYQSSRGGLTYG